MRASALLSMAALCSSSACAQNNGLHFNFPNGNVYDGTTPVVVEVWATYVFPFTAWAGWSGKILGDDVTGLWQNLTLIHHTTGPGGTTMPAPGVSPGTPSDGNVLGIINGQLHFPASGIFANTANPIHIWSGEWSSGNTAKRSVPLSTDTSKLSFYGIGSGWPLPDLEAGGEIVVIPAPAPALLMLVLAYARTRRTR